MIINNNILIVIMYVLNVRLIGAINMGMANTIIIANRHPLKLINWIQQLNRQTQRESRLIG